MVVTAAGGGNLSLVFSSVSPGAGEVARFIQSYDPRLIDTDLSVAADDDMFRSEERAAPDRPHAALSYFRLGLHQTDACIQVVNWRFGDLTNAGSLLDFAGGFGRTTRFLARLLPGAVWASDVLADAVTFQRDTFGVHAVLSTVVPEDLQMSTSFDVIFVASLFSHLPKQTFVRWLRRLYHLLNPGGVLAFSVLDEAVAPPGVTLDQDGFHFRPMSEIPSLDVADYGSTIVNERYVRTALAEATGTPAGARIPRGLSRHQDLYVRVRADDVDYTTLTFDPGPTGHVETAELVADGVRLTGWAVDDARAGVRNVEVDADGQTVGSTTVLSSRPDVAAVLGWEGFELSGWELVVPGPVQPSTVIVTSAVTLSGRRWAIGVSSLAELLSADGPGESHPKRTAVRTLGRRIANARRDYHGLPSAVAARVRKRGHQRPHKHGQ